MQCVIAGLEQTSVFVPGIRNIEVNGTYQIVSNIFTKHFHRYEYAYLNVLETETPNRA
jgi:hypothetical protein